MKKLYQPSVTFCLILICIVLSGCQPIQPMAGTAPNNCSNAKKISLFQTIIKASNAGDLEGMLTKYNKDGVLKVDAPPIFDSQLGQFKIADRYEGKGKEQLGDMLGGSIATQVNFQVDSIEVVSDSVVAEITATTPWFIQMGAPSDKLKQTHTAKYDQDCQILEYVAIYPEEFVKTLKQK